MLYFSIIVILSSNPLEWLKVGGVSAVKSEKKVSVTQDKLQETEALATTIEILIFTTERLDVNKKLGMCLIFSMGLYTGLSI